MSLMIILTGGFAVAAAAGQGGPASTPAMQISGSISNADYPAAAIRAGAAGTTRIQLNVNSEGRVAACSVIGSSGNAALDSASCNLAQQRYRFRPATRNGRPVATTVVRSIRWTPPRD